jgi:hypothetical protein
VQVQPAYAALHVGDTLRFQAAACDLTGGWTWRSLDTLIATVDPTPESPALAARARQL